MPQHLHTTGPKTFEGDLRLSSTADNPVPEQWIIFRISIGAGAILLLIAATLLVGAALSNAVAMPSDAGSGAITPVTRA